MTSETSTDVKEIIFINQAAFDEYAALPADAKESADARTTIIQGGNRLPSDQLRKLNGILAGISEIRIRFDSDTYRVYFAAEFREVIYILDAGIKKSPHGNEIPQWQTERLESRLAQAKQHYKNDGVAIKKRFEERKIGRETKP